MLDLNYPLKNNEVKAYNIPLKGTDHTRFNVAAVKNNMAYAAL
jgi:hypothetical protein